MEDLGGQADLQTHVEVDPRFGLQILVGGQEAPVAEQFVKIGLADVLGQIGFEGQPGQGPGISSPIWGLK